MAGDRTATGQLQRVANTLEVGARIDTGQVARDIAVSARIRRIADALDGGAVILGTDPLEAIDDIKLTALADGEILTWDAVAQSWTNESIVSAGTVIRLKNLADVDSSLAPAADQILSYNSTSEVWEAKNLSRSRGVTIELPSVDDEFSVWYTTKAITVTAIRIVLLGTSTPSVTWTLLHDPDRSAAGNTIHTDTTTDTTTGDEVLTFTDPTIPAGSFIWVEISAVSGTVDEIHFTLDYLED